jgi:hypothetical protein
VRDFNEVRQGKLQDIDWGNFLESGHLEDLRLNWEYNITIDFAESRLEEEATTEIGLWSQEGGRGGKGGGCETGSWIELAQDVQYWPSVLTLLILLVLLSECYFVYIFP